MDKNDTYDEEIPQNRMPPRQNWGRGISVSSMVGVVAAVGLVALILITLSLCSRPPPAGDPLAGSAGAGYGILERNVKAAFDNDAAERQDRSSDDDAGDALPDVQSLPSGTAQTQESSPQERRKRIMEEEREAMEMQEELRDRQREQVPSILPENPPRPVPLGGNNY